MSTGDKAVRDSTLTAIVTNGAPLTDLDNYPGFSPYNIVTVYGPPGMYVAADTTGVVKVAEAAGTDPTHSAPMPIGEGGYVSFHAYINAADVAQSVGAILAAGTVTISACNDAANTTGPLGLQFRPYGREPTYTRFLGCGSTSGASAQGQVAGSIYCGVDIDNLSDKKQYVEIQLLNANDAWVEGYKGANPPYRVWLRPGGRDGATGTAVASILSNVPQRGLQIQASLYDKQEFATFLMDFVAPPASL